MIHALHLLWIVPVSAMIGYAACALLRANGPDYDELPQRNEETKDSEPQ